MRSTNSSSAENDHTIVHSQYIFFIFNRAFSSVYNRITFSSVLTKSRKQTKKQLYRQSVNGTQKGVGREGGGRERERDRQRQRQRQTDRQTETQREAIDREKMQWEEVGGRRIREKGGRTIMLIVAHLFL